MSRLLLVTGGLGFIGSHVVERALAAGWRVRIVDSVRADVHIDDAALDWLAGLPGPVEFDRRDVAELEVGDLRDVSVLCHHAGKVGLGLSFADAPDYVRSNSLASALLFDTAARAGVRQLVLASSMVVYGEGHYRAGGRIIQPPPRQLADLLAGRFDPLDGAGRPLEPVPLSEDAGLDPRNTYAASKLEQELLAASWARETGGVAALLRFHNVFGARMNLGTPYAGVSGLFRSRLELGRAPLVFEDGQQRRDFVDVLDVARANLAAVDWAERQRPGTVRAFNIASGVARTVLEFAAALAAAMHGPEPRITGEFRMGDVRHITASTHRAGLELDWRAERDFAESIAEFAGAEMRGVRADSRRPTGE